MFWSCEICNDWGTADSEVDAAVERQLHRAVHTRPPKTEEPQQEADESEDTVLRLKYLAWGTTALLGLLSAEWPALAGVVPCAGLLAFVLTFHEGASND